MGKLLGKASLKILMSCASEEFIQWAIMSIAGKIVLSTENETDNEWYNKIKEGLEKE